MKEPEHPYEIVGREIVAEAPGPRVQVLSIDPGQCVPWHHHTRIVDTFFRTTGRVLIETRAPDARHELGLGERFAVPAGQPYQVSPVGDAPCAFVIPQDQLPSTLPEIREMPPGKP